MSFLLPLQKDIHPRCLEIMSIHSECVYQKAWTLAQHSPYRDCIDYAFLREASMLHDYGIVGVDAPGIFCFGTAPYIAHGVLGAAHLRALDARRYARHARVCEVHIGSGLTRAEVETQRLPMAAKDYLPITLEEKLVTYADNFYSKNPDHLREEKSFEHIVQSMSRHGTAAVERLYALRAMWENAM